MDPMGMTMKRQFSPGFIDLSIQNAGPIIEMDHQSHDDMARTLTDLGVKCHIDRPQISYCLVPVTTNQ